MDTFLGITLESYSPRWSEIDSLLDAASQNETKNHAFYAALCRAAVVLISAHLEGFCKDIAKSILDDLNFYSEYAKSPEIIQHKFSSYFTESKDKATQLSEIFKSAKIHFKAAPFFADDNWNPSMSAIERVCNAFGLSRFFKSIHNSRLDEAFEDSPEKTSTLMDDLRSATVVGAQSFPYSFDLDAFRFSTYKSDKAPESTLWRTYIEDLLTNRHSIAHGNIFENNLGHVEVLRMKEKAVILHFALACLIGSQVSKSTKP